MSVNQDDDRFVVDHPAARRWSVPASPRDRRSGPFARSHLRVYGNPQLGGHDGFRVERLTVHADRNQGRLVREAHGMVADIPALQDPVQRAASRLPGQSELHLSGERLGDFRVVGHARSMH